MDLSTFSIYLHFQIGFTVKEHKYKLVIKNPVNRLFMKFS